MNLEKDNALPQTVFVLNTFFSDATGYPAKLTKEFLGYFTELPKAEYYLQRKLKDFYWFHENKAFKIFEIEEHGFDYFLLHLRTRVYNANGKFLGERWMEYEDGYPGRNKKDCKFRIGDIVQYINNQKLEVGKVIAMPPTPNEVQKRTAEKTKEFAYLGISRWNPFDVKDDGYQVVNQRGLIFKPNVTHVFRPSLAISPTTTSRLENITQVLPPKKRKQ